MKLNISKNEATKGLVFKKKIYEMWVSCEMTPEELAAYKSVESEIKDMLIVEYQMDGLELNFRIRDLVYTHTKPDGKGRRFEFSPQHEIPEMEKSIKENAKGFADYLKKVQAGGSLGEESMEL